MIRMMIIIMIIMIMIIIMIRMIMMIRILILLDDDGQCKLQQILIAAAVNDFAI